MTAPGPSLAGEDYCYLTTTGRVSGKPHTIEIWFSLEAGVLYLLAGSRERADWVRNLRRAPSVQVRIRDVTYNATAVLSATSPKTRSPAASSSRNTRPDTRENSIPGAGTLCL